ncbi:MAG: gamma-glutamyltransferase, partial [Phycisphaerae bacterium]|nr:gamma-glutamyltransferase [Phycisphaerae bacterium]
MLPTTFDHPYPSRREPVFGDAVVATSQPLAAQAGLEMLAEGGSSLDAAIATAAALTVTEPTSNGLGSDAFCLHWDAHRLHGFNGSGRSPAAFDAEGILARGQIDPVGWEPVTTPGAIDAWFTLHERFGTLPMARLLEPAIRMAQDGFRVAPQTAYYWAKSSAKFGHLTGWANTFTRDGRTPRPGEQVQLPEHALTLKTLARDGREAFYRGELAERLHDYSMREGGALRAEDLASHSGMWVDPISMT